MTTIAADPNILLMLARRVWINPASNWVQWECSLAQRHVCWIHSTADLIKRLRKAGWGGGDQPMAMQYLWKTEPERLASPNPRVSGGQIAETNTLQTEVCENG